MTVRIPTLLAAVLAAGFAAPAFASSCWTPTLASADNGYGLPASSPRLARLRGALDAAESLLRADPGLSAVDGFRLQARRRFGRDEQHARRDTATLWLRFHAPDTWAGEGCTVDQGRADYFNQHAIELVFNDVAPLLRASGATGDDGEPLLVTLDPERLARFRETGLLLNVGEGVRAFRADGRPVLLPFTVEAHLALWERRLEALVAAPGGEAFAPQLEALRGHRDSLSQAAASAQVRQPGHDPAQLWSYAPAGDADSVPVYQVDPELLKPVTDPSAVSLLTISYYAHADDERLGPVLADWVAGFSPAQAARLFAAGGVR